MKHLISCLIAITVAAGVTAPVLASAFWPGTVMALGATDTLKVRKWPSASSQIIDAYALGSNISLTGRCKDIKINVSFRIDGKASANWKYARMKKAHVWCQTMTSGAQLGWVRGQFVWPQ
ncbi:MAG: hypothetical protein ACRCT6_03395 [Notoacmeibacter sp.]